MKPNVTIVNPKDNVAIALEDVAAGAAVLLPDGKEIKALNDIPFSHKVAIIDIGAGEEIIKYGEVIGHAQEAVSRGDWVHSHNLTVNE